MGVHEKQIFVTTISTQPIPNEVIDTNKCLKSDIGVIYANSLERSSSLADEITGLKQFILTLSAALMVMFILITLVFFFTYPTNEASIKSDLPFDWPPPSESVEGKFEKAAITTDHQICSEIGGNILKRGGNAVDAAVAAMFCLGVTNPQSSGLGGGFLMTIYNKTSAKCSAIDARESAPAAAHRDMYGNDSVASKIGHRAVAVPGELAGYWHAFTQYGSGRVSWKDLIRPSIQLCRKGVPVSVFLGYVMGLMDSYYRKSPSMRSWINPLTNTTYKTGDRILRLKLAKTLEMIAKSKDPVKLFYRGKMADTIAKEMAEAGGIITKEDLARYKPVVHQGMEHVRFRGDLAICGGPPPSSFSVTQLIVSVMSGLYPPGHKADILRDPKVMHHFLEAMKFGYAQRTLLGDVAFVPSAYSLAKNLTTNEYTEWILKRVRDTAQPTAYYGGNTQSQVPDHGTSHVSVLDEYGNGVSATSTINRWFGAIVQSEAYGIVWNDEMDDFSTPGMANGFGFAPSQTNFIEPGKRPMSSMSPIVIFDKSTGEPRMVVGASGGAKIISSVAKAIVRSLIFGESIKQAIDSPMIHNQFTPDITQIDNSFPKELKNILETQFGQRFRNTSGFEGIVQGITVDCDGIRACGDFRRKTDQKPSGY